MQDCALRAAVNRQQVGNGQGRGGSDVDDGTTGATFVLPHVFHSLHGERDQSLLKIIWIPFSRSFKLKIDSEGILLVVYDRH